MRRGLAILVWLLLCSAPATAQEIGGSVGGGDFGGGSSSSGRSSSSGGSSSSSSDSRSSRDRRTTPSEREDGCRLTMFSWSSP